MSALRLEWNRPRPMSADIRGAYTRAFRDPERRLSYWILMAQCTGIRTLVNHARERGASLEVFRAR